MTEQQALMTDEQIRERTLQLVKDYQQLSMEKRMQEWTELWHEEAVLEWPFAPDGRQQTYRGKAAILAAMTPALGRAEFHSVRYFKVHPLLDPNSVVVEMGTHATFIPTNRPYNQTYVFYIETRDGKIWRYREYFNVQTLMNAWGGQAAFNAQWGQPDAEPHDRPYLTD